MIDKVLKLFDNMAFQMLVDCVLEISPMFIVLSGWSTGWPFWIEGLDFNEFLFEVFRNVWFEFILKIFLLTHGDVLREQFIFNFFEIVKDLKIGYAYNVCVLYWRLESEEIKCYKEGHMFTLRI